MKKLMLVGMTIIGIFFLSACASTPTYLIELSDGVVYEAKTKPIFDKDTGFYTYIDKDGKEVMIKGDIVRIKQK